MVHSEIRSKITSLADAEKARVLSGFFKTGVGEYGEGDQFLGITMPQLRSAVRPFVETCGTDDLERLISDPFHEIRMAAVVACVEKYRRSTAEAEREALFEWYVRNLRRLNNWDFIDVSAPHVLGGHLRNKKDRLDTLSKLAVSDSLWEKRAAVVATFSYIREKDSEYTFAICDLLLGESHDLLHKAAGWMLREVGKHCGEKVLLEYLRSRYERLPRTSLRYAIERFSAEDRRRLLSGEFEYFKLA